MEAAAAAATAPPAWWDNPTAYIVGVIVVGGALLGIGTWIGGMNSFKSTVEPFMREIRDDIKEIFKSLSPTTSSASPVRLTDLGKAISEELDARRWAREIATTTLAARSTDLTEEYELFELAETYVQEEFRPPEEFERRLKASAYNHGIKPDQVRRVLIVELRDAFLSLRNE